jgi:hypothetical protein
MQGCSIVVTLELSGNTTFAMTNYLVRPWKLYSCTVVIGRDTLPTPTFRMMKLEA